MIKKSIACSVLFASLFLMGGAPEQKADTVLRHGRIYTMDAPRSWAESIAIQGERIHYIGDDPGVVEWIGPQTQVIELSGKFVLPSFIDSHVHPLSAGIDMGRLDFDAMTTKEQILKATADHAASHPDEKWILGSNWQLPVFPQANPKKEWLDEIVPERPVLMTSADGHSVWVNSKALELAGITKSTPDPEGGRIERNENGEPSGTLRESATDLVYKVAPEPTPEERFRGLQNALKKMNALGITGFQDASVGPEALKTYLETDKGGFLTARVTAAQYADPEKPVEQIADLKSLRASHQGKRLHATAVKIFVDGVIEANTAAMLNPYVDTKTPGELLWKPEKLNEFVKNLDREGFQVHFHAIGDWAVRAALNSVEEARKVNGFRDSRPIFSHIEVIDPAEIKRFGPLGAIPCFQPLWAWEDEYIKDLTIPKLSRERARWIYPIRSVMSTGATMALGSDWSVSSVNPLDGIEVAVRRQGINVKEDGPAFIPEERISLHTALAAYTIGSAYANFWEKETGSLEKGKSADLIVLSQNLFEIAPSEINETTVTMTILEGKIIHQ